MRFRPARLFRDNRRWDVVIYPDANNTACVFPILGAILWMFMKHINILQTYIYTSQ